MGKDNIILSYFTMMKSWTNKFKLENISQEFEHSIQRIEDIAEITRHGMKDFPNNLPQSLKDQIKRDFDTIDSVIEVKSEPIKGKSESIVIESTILQTYFELEAIPEDAHEVIIGLYDSVVNSQVLVSAFTYFEAYISELIRFFCDKNPNLLKKSEKKPANWNEVLEAGSWENVLTLFTEKYIHSIGLKQFLEFIVECSKLLSLDFKITTKEREVIKKAYNVRNIWVHNNGRKNQQYVQNLGIDMDEIGQLYNIDLEYLNKVIKCLRGLQKRFQDTVIKKFT